MNNKNIVEEYPECMAPMMYVPFIPSLLDETALDMTSHEKIYGTSMWFNDMPETLIHDQVKRRNMSRVGLIDFVSEHSILEFRGKIKSMDELRAERLKELEKDL